MNEELANILEQALQYASPLPVASTENMVTYSPETTATSGLVLQHTSSSNLEQLCDISLDSHSDKTENFSQTSLDAHQNAGWCQPVHFSLTESSMANFPDDSNSNQGYMFYQFDNQSLESLDHFSNKIIGYQDKGFADIDIRVNEESSDSNFAQLETMSLTEVHPDSTSGVLNDTSDITDACLQFENDSKPSLDSTVCFETDNVKPKIKRRRRREKNPDPPPPTILPPCDICNEKSSGYHYGANTCEACKGFYRRTLKKKEVNFKCKCTPNEKEAWKRGPFKNVCSACRYEKCLAVGMSKNAIKIGRYTLNHKTRNIKKIKSIETIDTLITALAETVSDSSRTSTTVSGTSTTTASNDDSAELIMDHSDHSDASNPVPVKRQRMASPDAPGSSVIYLRSTPDAHESSVISLREIDSIVKVLTEAHTTLCVDERINMPAETIRMKQYEYLEKYTTKQEVFGSMGNLTDDEFTDFYNATGMDIDGRIERIHEGFRYFEEKIRTIIDFAKAIPGFRALGFDDQANLIKATRVENSIISIYKVVLKSADPERRVVTLPWGATMHVDEIKTIVPVDVLCKRRKILKRLLELNLSVQEESVLRAMLIVSSDRCKLDEPQMVDLIQEKLVACLQHLINLRPGASGTLLYKIFNLITNMRDLTDRNLDFAKSFLFKWPMLSLSNYNLLKDFTTFKVS